QAEDGIRDFHVTGVQTCALPIYREGRPGAVVAAVLADLEVDRVGARGVDAHEDLPDAGLGPRHLGGLEDLGAAESMLDDGAHGRAHGTGSVLSLRCCGSNSRRPRRPRPVAWRPRYERIRP